MALRSTSLMSWASQTRWLPRLVEASALIVLGLALARIFWLVWLPSGAVSSVTQVPVLNSVQVDGERPVRQSDRSLLLRTNAFMPVGNEGVEAEVEDVPETSLNLVLKGLRSASGEGASSSATIVTPNNEVGVYVIGAQIIDGVVLTRILSDRVILEKNGAFESLFLEGRTGELSVIGGSEPRQAVGGHTVVEPSIYRIASFDALMRDVRLEQSSDPQGWQIAESGGGQALAAIGLREGDFLLSVNGREAESLAYEDLAGLLARSDRIDLAVRRGTETRRVTLVFEERNER